MEKLLLYFDDESFSAVDYIDSLYTSSVPNYNLNNNNNITTLNKTFNSLLINLEVYSDALLSDLNKSFDDLSRSCGLIGSYDDPDFASKFDKLHLSNDHDLNNNNNNNDDNDDNNDDADAADDADDVDADDNGNEGKITRLQYYVDNLLNIANGLTLDSQKIIENYKDINNKSKDEHLPINTLIALKQIRANLDKVSKLFQTAKFIATISLNAEASNDNDNNNNTIGTNEHNAKFAPTSINAKGNSAANNDSTTTANQQNSDDNLIITPLVFKNSLDILEEIIIEQLNVNKSIITSSKSAKSMDSVDFSNKDLISKIDSLIELKYFFKNLNFYDQAYLSFVTKMEQERNEFAQLIDNKKTALQDSSQQAVSAKSVLETKNSNNNTERLKQEESNSRTADRNQAKVNKSNEKQTSPDRKSVV